jgi:hypothetical protein
VFDYPTIATLSAYISAEVYGWTAHAPAQAAAKESDALELIEGMSEQDIEKLFMQRSGGVP